MAGSLLAQLAPPPNIATTLYTVPLTSAYIMCDLIVTSTGTTGIMFSLGIGKSSIINPQDYVINMNQILLDSNRNIINIYQKNRILVGQGENIIFFSTLSNLNVRLTGYSVPYISQPLNID